MFFSFVKSFQNLTRSFKVNAETINEKSNEDYDVVIVGGGIIGCATARELSLRHKNFKIALLEKENELAMHQSSHNSGVLHSGIYYTPGTLKAKLCVQGFHLMYNYLKEKNIPFKKCGKLIVAVHENELEKLNDLFEKSLKNNVKDVKVLDQNEIKKLEPNCFGLKAIWSPHTGIVDYSEVARNFAKDFEDQGGKIYLNFNVSKIDFYSKEKSLIVSDNLNKKNIKTKFIITAAGLYSDKVSQLTGCEKFPAIIPFRGEYLALKENAKNIIKTNIYPVPNPKLPFLGVHFTPTMDGKIILGPNAVLATKREGYSISNFNLKEFYEIITNQGALKLMIKFYKEGFDELKRSIFINQQIEILKRYVPSLKKENVKRSLTGVRAQAIDTEGNLIEDFCFDSGKGEIANYVLHVRNAPSPAATSSLAIAKMIADKFEEKLKNELK